MPLCLSHICTLFWKWMECKKTYIYEIYSKSASFFSWSRTRNGYVDLFDSNHQTLLLQLALTLFLLGQLFLLRPHIL